VANSDPLQFSKRLRGKGQGVLKITCNKYHALTSRAVIAKEQAFMDVRDQIIVKLKNSLHPHSLDVSDDSHRHAGHSGNPSGGEGTHFTITIVSNAFAGHNRVSRHRMIYSILDHELKSGVHALAINAKTIDE